jgi:tRNA A-37 threonylcarbamoyl transferase component Bud32
MISISVIIIALGVLIIPVTLTVLYLFKRRADVSVRVVLSVLSASIIAEACSAWIERTASIDFLNQLTRLSVLPIDTFPASYSAISAAVTLTVSVYIPRAYRKWAILTFMLVGAAQLHLGISLPLDVIGGWLVGLFCYSFIALALGSRYAPVNPSRLARKLQEGGLKGAQVKPASVDARGSVPFFGKYEDGDIFVKVFNQDNNAADWLFKIIRRLQYRRLEDEVPSLTPKRAIEHEAYLTMLATHNAKVRVPELLGIYKVDTNMYAMATRRLQATGLDKIDGKKITDKMLDGVWQQINKLHKHHIIHKDLRAANVMIEDSTSLPWLIDFGFSECAVNKRSNYKDNVEFIASSATKVGAKKAVAAAVRALGPQVIEESIPYMQYAALSGASTTDLKKDGNLLDEIKKEMNNAINAKPGDIKKANLHRVSIPKRK